MALPRRLVAQGSTAAGTGEEVVSCDPIARRDPLNWHYPSAC